MESPRLRKFYRQKCHVDHDALCEITRCSSPLQHDTTTKTNLLWVYTKHYRQVLVDRHHAPDGVLSQEFLGAFQRQKVAQRPVRVGGFDQVAYAVNPLLVINVEDFTAHIAEEKNSNNLSFIDEQIMKCIL